MMADNNGLVADFEELVLPNDTWYIDFEEEVVTNMISDLESVKQAAFLALNTERYEFIIYSNQYGFELIDLFGENQQFVMSEIKRRVTEALMQDDRITSVDNFKYNRIGTRLEVTFTVSSSVGKFDAETEVTL